MSDAIADNVDDFGTMDVSQVGYSQYRVTNYEGGEVRSYLVDLSEGSCTCDHGQHNPDDGEACKHLAKANHQAPSSVDPGLRAMRDASELFNDAQRAVQRLEAAGMSQASHNVAEGEQTPTEAEEGQPSISDEDAVQTMRSLLKSSGLDPDDFDVWVDDDLGSLQLDTDAYLDDDEFEAWVDFKEDLPIYYDGDEDRNYLKREDWPEVLG